jgi:broad specificity phosphatase PhoE
MKGEEFSGIRIILVRHGETEWNRLHRFQGRSDIALNSKGNNQANALSLALQNETITAIYTSPLGRALETALHVSRFHPGIPLIKESGFLEMDLGDFEGMEAQRWAAEHHEFRKAWEKSPAALAMPGGESLRDVQQRAVAALERICKAYSSGSTLLICLHNFVIGSLLCFASKLSLDDFRQVRQNTAALNIIYKDGSDFEVETVNDCRHLKE